MKPLTTGWPRDGESLVFTLCRLSFSSGFPTMVGVPSITRILMCGTAVDLDPSVVSGGNGIGMMCGEVESV